MSSALLIVEDESPAREALAGALADLDFSIRFTDGSVVLGEIKSHPPDLLLLDVGARGMDLQRVVRELTLAGPTRPRLLLFTASREHAVPPSILPLEHVRSACIAAQARSGASGWFDTWIDQSTEDAARRIAVERDRLIGLGILDAGGRPTSAELPPDMRPGSKSDVTT